MKKKMTLLGMLFLLCFVCACGTKQSEEITSIEQLNEAGRHIGVLVNTAEDRLVEQELPLAEIEYYKDDASVYLAVSQGKLDAVVFNKPSMEKAIDSGLQGVRILEEPLGEPNVGAVAFASTTRIPDLKEKVNAFLAEIEADGTKDDMVRRWVVEHNETMPEIEAPENPELHIVIGTTGLNAPFTFYSGTELNGYDIELAYRFAAWLNASMEWKIYDYEGIIAAAQSGDVDCIFANLFITPERAEALEFSDPTYIGEVGVMVRDTNAAGTAAETAGADAARAGAAEYTTFEELGGKTVSMLTGAPFEDLVRSLAPDVKEFTFFNNTPDMLLALKSHKTDAVLSNNAIATLAANRDAAITLFSEELKPGVFGLAFRKGDPELADWQKAYDAISEETKQALWGKWTGADEGAKILPAQDWPGANGTVTAAVCDTLEPMSYAGKDGELIGFDIEMILLMARERDIHVDFTGMEFSAVLSAVQSGKAQIGAGSIIVTDERKESVDFVEYYPAAFVLMVRSVQTQGEGAAQRTLADLEHATLGVLTGTNFPEIAGKYLPEAEQLYYNTTADEVNALKGGKIDAIVLDGPVARNMQAEDDTLELFPEEMGWFEYAFVTSKDADGEALCEAMSEYIRALEADGTQEELQKKWFDAADHSAVEMDDYRDLPAKNGTVKLATFSYPPFTFAQDGMHKGYEIEILTRFCRDNGYALEIEEMSADGVLAAVQSGKCKVGASSIAITDERKEQVLFSEPTYSGGTALLVRKETKEAAAGGFLQNLQSSFEKTFVREGRWKLFVQGIGTTLLITVLSILFGTLVGFGAFMLARKGNPVAVTITRLLVWLVQDMPVVVLLMILYYIVFGKADISGTAVSVVGFTLVFGAGVYAMLKAGVGAVDRGQAEAAYALGYTDRRTFYRIILPQALPHFMPTYKGEITSLIKATAVVGYVAVQDLTKMGDLVRSRTYEAFFPLIAVAIIYFVLAALLTQIVNRIELRIDPRRRSIEEIQKEVNPHD